MLVSIHLRRYMRTIIRIIIPRTYVGIIHTELDKHLYGLCDSWGSIHHWSGIFSAFIV